MLPYVVRNIHIQLPESKDWQRPNRIPAQRQVDFNIEDA
jgi:hypothetical protein